MRRDWHSGKNTPEWYENYDRCFKRREAKHEQTTAENRPEKSPAEKADAFKRAFPFCPYLRGT